MKPRLLALLSALLLPAPLYAATYDWEDRPEANHEMAFRLFVPDTVPKVRAVIALVPGFNGDGRKMADDMEWQMLAERTQSAVIACKMRGDAGGIYYEPDKWSGKVLLQALKEFAKQSNHPEIADAPLALWGHSAGGQFNFNFANWKPERTIAFVANKGAYYGETIRPMTRKVPALWILGDKDKDIRIKNITDRYETGRKSGALWALVPEPNMGHGLGRSRDIGMVFIEEVINSRFDSFGRLQPANPAKGWLGDLDTKSVSQNATSDGGSKKLSWLPGEKTANLWVEVITGTPGTTTPAAPPAEEPVQEEVKN